MLRVAVQHTDPNHPNAGVAAYRLGSIDDFTHPIEGVTTPAHAVAVSLLDEARKEFPESEGYRVWVQSLEPDGTESCYRCNGEGQRPTVAADGDNLQIIHEDCSVCGGDGQTAKSRWADVDEQAVRDRAAGQDAEVPLVDQLPTSGEHSVGVDQPQAPAVGE